MRVAITGADGFLGTAVLKKLKKEKIPYTTFDFNKHDLLKTKSLKNLVLENDVIIHLAAVNRGNNTELFKINVLGTQCLLEAINLYSPNAKIVFASSFQVYLKNGLYGFSKRMAEELIKYYSVTTEIRGVIFRISNIYGPGGKPYYNSVIATIAYLIKKDEIVKINGDGTQKRDFIYVDDVADAIIKACKSPQKRKVEIIDLCFGKETSLNHVLNILGNASGKKIKVEYNRGVKEKPWPTTTKNFKKAYQMLKWKPKIDLTNGLKKVINYK